MLRSFTPIHHHQTRSMNPGMSTAPRMDGNRRTGDADGVVTWKSAFQDIRNILEQSVIWNIISIRNSQQWNISPSKSQAVKVWHLHFHHYLSLLPTPVSRRDFQTIELPCQSNQKHNRKHRSFVYSGSEACPKTALYNLSTSPRLVNLTWLYHS